MRGLVNPPFRPPPFRSGRIFMAAGRQREDDHQRKQRCEQHGQRGHGHLRQRQQD